MYQLELVWNREFDFVRYGSPCATLDEAISLANKMENMSNGEAVKKTRVVDDNDLVVWAYGKKVSE